MLLNLFTWKVKNKHFVALDNGSFWKDLKTGVVWNGCKYSYSAESADKQVVLKKKKPGWYSSCILLPAQ